MPPPVPEPARAFSATDAAFAGFRLVRRRPQVVLALAGVNLVLLVVFAVAMVTMAGPDLMRMQAMGPRPDPAQAIALFGRLAPFYALAFVLMLATYAVVYASVSRTMLRPGSGWAGIVRLGGDELRQGLALLIVGATLFVVYIVVAAVGLILVGVVAAAAPGAKAAAGALALGVALLVMGVLLVLSVRLSLTNPLAFDSGRIDLRGAWRLSRRRFWPLLGAYALAWCVMLVLGLGFMVAYSALGLVAGGGAAGLKTVFQPDLSSLSAYFTPLSTLYMLASSLLYGLGFVVLIGASVDAYRQITGQGTAQGPAAATFDRSTHFGLHV